MNKVQVEFVEYDGSINVQVEYSELRMHLIFDIKVSKNFRRKVRLVADGHIHLQRSHIPLLSVHKTQYGKCYLLQS